LKPWRRRLCIALGLNLPPAGDIAVMLVERFGEGVATRAILRKV